MKETIASLKAQLEEHKERIRNLAREKAALEGHIQGKVVLAQIEDTRVAKLEQKLSLKEDKIQKLHQITQYFLKGMIYDDYNSSY